MTGQIGFIGDIHGVLHPLEKLVARAQAEADTLVFLGDYVNRGSQSREVIDYLITFRGAWDGSCVFLSGHHDLAFLRAIDHDRLDSFLRMGGAATLASYPPVASSEGGRALLHRVPTAHVEFLRALEVAFERSDLVATHAPDQRDEEAESRFRVLGHYPQKNLVPRVSSSDAFIDTGCGTLPDGRLTCFLWPSRRWFQST